jgi:hypothetical protein
MAFHYSVPHSQKPRSISPHQKLLSKVSTHHSHAPALDAQLNLTFKNISWSNSQRITLRKDGNCLQGLPLSLIQPTRRTPRPTRSSSGGSRRTSSSFGSSQSLPGDPATPRLLARTLSQRAREGQNQLGASTGYSGDTGSRRRSSITRILTAEEQAAVLEGHYYEEGTGFGEEKGRERVEQFAENLEQVPEGDETERQDGSKDLSVGGGDRGSFSEDSLGKARGSESEAGAGSWTNATQELPPGDLRQIDTSTAGMQPVTGGNGLEAAASDAYKSENEPQGEESKGSHAGTSAKEQDAVLTACGQEGTAPLTVDNSTGTVDGGAGSVDVSTLQVNASEDVQTGARSIDQLRTAKVEEKMVEIPPDREGETGGVFARGCEGSLGEARASDPGIDNLAFGSAEGGMSERALVDEEPEEVERVDVDDEKETPAQTEFRSLEQQTETAETSAETNKLAEGSSLEDNEEKTSSQGKGSLQSETALKQEGNQADHDIFNSDNELGVGNDLETNGTPRMDEHLQEEEAEGQREGRGKEHDLAEEESSFSGGVDTPKEDKRLKRLVEENVEEESGSTKEDGMEQESRFSRKESPQQRDLLTKGAAQAVDKEQEDNESSRGGTSSVDDASQGGNPGLEEEQTEEQQTSATQKVGFEVHKGSNGETAKGEERRRELQETEENQKYLPVNDSAENEAGREEASKGKVATQWLSVNGGFEEQKSLEVPVKAVDQVNVVIGRKEGLYLATRAELQESSGKGGGWESKREPKAGVEMEAVDALGQAGPSISNGTVAAEAGSEGISAERGGESKQNDSAKSNGMVALVTSDTAGPYEKSGEGMIKGGKIEPFELQVAASSERPESGRLPNLKGPIDASRGLNASKMQNWQTNPTANGDGNTTGAGLEQLTGAKQGLPVMDNTGSNGTGVTKPSTPDRTASLKGSRSKNPTMEEAEGGATEVGSLGKVGFPHQDENRSVRENVPERIERRVTVLADGAKEGEIEGSPTKGKKHKKKRRATTENVAEAPDEGPPASGERGKWTAGGNAPSSREVEKTAVCVPADLVSMKAVIRGRGEKAVPGDDEVQAQAGKSAEYSEADYQDSRSLGAGPSHKGESSLLISAEEELDTVPEAVALKANESLAPLEDAHERAGKGKKKKGKKSRRGSEEERQSQQPEHSDPAAVELSESSSKDDVQIQSVEQTAGAGSAADGKRKKGKKSRRGSEEKGASQHWEQSESSADGVVGSSVRQFAKEESVGQESGEPLGQGESSQLDGITAEGKKKKKSKGLRKKRRSEDQSLESGEEKGGEGTRKELQAGASAPDTAKEGREKYVDEVDEDEGWEERVGAERGAERLAPASAQKERNGSAECGGVEVVEWHEIEAEEVEADAQEGAVSALPSFGVKEQRRVHGREGRGGSSATNEEQSDVDGLTVKGEPAMDVDDAGQTESGSHEAQVATGVVRQEQDSDREMTECGSDDVGKKLKLALAGRKGKRGSTGSLYYPEQALGAASVSPGREEAVRKPAQTGQSEPAQVRRVLILPEALKFVLCALWVLSLRVPNFVLQEWHERGG